MVSKTAQVQFSGVAVFRSVTHIGVQHPAFSHTFLHGKVQYGFLLTVINSGYTAIVALAVVRLYLVHHLCGQVLHGHLGVVVEEFLSAHHDFLYGLTVNLDGSVVLHLRSGQFAHQFFQVGTFGQTVCRTVIHKSVFLHLHLCGTGCHFCGVHQLGILQQCHGAYVCLLLLLVKCEVAEQGLIAHVCDTQDIVSRLYRWQFEFSVLTRLDARGLRAVLRMQQHHRSKRQRLAFHCAIHHFSRHGNLLRQDRGNAQAHEHNPQKFPLHYYCFFV